MIIAHLLFAHLLADYPLQTNWLVVRKGQAWYGLALHGAMVFLMMILVLPGDLSVLLVPMLILTFVHMFQDWVKVYSGPRIKIHPFIPYILDQVLHYTAIIIFQMVVASQLEQLGLAPSPAEIWVMALGAVVIIVTRFYDVTWWANWLDMILYMNRWAVWGFAERLAMVALSVVGLFYAAPLCVLPRLLYAQSQGMAITKQRRGSLEMGIGVVLSVGCGLVLRVLLLS